MSSERFEVLRPSRFYLYLEECEEQRVLLRSAIVPAMASVFKLFALLMGCGLAYEFVVYGGLALGLTILIENCRHDHAESRLMPKRSELVNRFRLSIVLMIAETVESRTLADTSRLGAVLI